MNSMRTNAIVSALALVAGMGSCGPVADDVFTGMAGTYANPLPSGNPRQHYTCAFDADKRRARNKAAKAARRKNRK